MTDADQVPEEVADDGDVRKLEETVPAAERGKHKRRPKMAPDLAQNLLALIPAGGEWVTLGWLAHQTFAFLSIDQCGANYQRHLEWGHNGFKADVSVEDRCAVGREYLITDTLRYHVDRGDLQCETRRGAERLQTRYRRARPVAPNSGPGDDPRPRLAVADIRIGERVRGQVGALAGLANSIRKVGLLHAIVVDQGHNLIAGFRRLKACESLGWREVPVTVVRNLQEAGQALRAERDENTCRKDLTVEEALAVQRLLLPFEKAAARERQRDGGRRGGKTAGKGRPKEGDRVLQNLEEPIDEGGAAIKVAADATGYSHETLRKAAKVVEAATESPADYDDLRELMRAEGKVDPAYRELRRRQAAGLEVAPAVPAPQSAIAPAAPEAEPGKAPPAGPFDLAGATTPAIAGGSGSQEVPTHPAPSGPAVTDSISALCDRARLLAALIKDKLLAHLSLDQVMASSDKHTPASRQITERLRRLGVLIAQIDEENEESVKQIGESLLLQQPIEAGLVDGLLSAIPEQPARRRARSKG